MSRRRVIGGRVFALAAIGGGLAACSAILDLESPPDYADGGTFEQMTDGASGVDATAPGSGTGDGSTTPPGTDSGDGAGEPVTDAGAVCAALADGDGATTYRPFAQTTLSDGGSAWQLFDVSSISGSETLGFTAGAFDGRYLYLASRQQPILRFDTQGNFQDGTKTSWQRFLPTSAGYPSSTTYSGAVYDGHYVYFLPASTATASVSTPESAVLRYDPTNGEGTKFTSASSWSLFDVSTLTDAGTSGLDAGVPASGFAGGTFDGRYVYLVPHNDGRPDGRVVRYDTTSDDAGALEAGSSADAGDAGDAAVAVPNGFVDRSHWSTFDLMNTPSVAGSSLAAGFAGAVYDGKTIFFVPQLNAAYDSQQHGGNSGIAARYVTTEPFTTASSWSTFDLTTVNGLAEDFWGGAFDGRYVYFAPHSGNGIVVRLDTQTPTVAGVAPFSTIGDWSTFDLTTVVSADAGSLSFTGAAFDGRFVTFVPSGTGFGTAVRYDTRSTFGAACAWSTIDLTQVHEIDGGGPGFSNGSNAVFDGEYLYIIPAGNGVLARFDARTYAPLPALPSFFGSF